jgi:two-component system chemotaxis sensor kinase CheA
VTGIAPEIMELARGEASVSLARLEETLLALESATVAPGAIDAMFRDAHSIKGTASMVGWTGVAAVARAMEDRLADCRTRGTFPAELVDPMLRATDALRRAVAGETDSAAGVVEELDGVVVAEPAAAEPAHDVVVLPAVAARPAIRVPADKVDRLLDAVGEAVMHQSRLAHELGDPIPGSGDDLAREELDIGARLLGELQESVIEMRTLPLSSITAGYPRAVRDLAANEGKQVQLVISGGETSLDRVILEGIAETITHLLRNAIAHGIEPPDERVAAGKPAGGRVELRAEQRGGMVAIEVADDGRGVDAALVASAGDAASLTDLLSTPGFSTAAQVGDLAGRGVGLDAVRSNVMRIGGSMEIRSEPGRGTVVALLLPITLALLRVLLCERGGQTYGVALHRVREVVAVTETLSIGGRPFLDLRGDSIPIADLAAVIGASCPPLPGQPPALILALTGRAVAITCDRVRGDREVVMKSLGPLLREVRGYLGAAILGDGRVALILDPSHLLAMHRASAAAQRIAESGERHAPNLLVVDDQFTVRELQRSILETAGYHVETARDGLEALRRLARDPAVDLVLTDVQMPEMDGFELLRAIRREPAHHALPVVLVTSMGAAEDRLRGVEEGADAYMVKDEFDQRTLLETVGRLVGR